MGMHLSIGANFRTLIYVGLEASHGGTVKKSSATLNTLARDPSKPRRSGIGTSDPLGYEQHGGIKMGK